MTSHAWTFALGVFQHWIALVTGSIVSLLILIYEKSKDRPVKWKKILFVFFLGLLVSLFFAWQDEYTSAIWRGQDISNLEKQLEDLKNPKFRASIDSVMLAPMGLHNKDCVITLTAMITNTGAPSVALNMRARVVKADGAILRSPILLPPQGKITMFEGSDSNSPGVVFESAD
jgi:hypothetical protein